MENRKYVKFLIPVFILGFFILSVNNVLAYDTDTHAFLTDEIVKFYNKNFSDDKISNDLIPYLADGSRREDDIPRWMNHFYDPVYNRGLSYDPRIDTLNLGTWQKSKDWAQDSANQNSLVYKVPATIASVLTALEQGKISAITAETDFTWQQAIKFYIQGDKEKAMFMLGHVLHLIEDASVPDHTRNDPHPYDSPYEIYTSQFDLANPDESLKTRLNDKTPIILTDLSSYFNELANYSNNNFYSKDTIGIQSGYDLPQVDLAKYKTINGLYYLLNQDDAGNEYVLAVKNSINENVITTKFNITIDNALAKNDYWSILSTKSVQYGAGVINLFFQEAEKAKNNQNNNQQPKSFLSQVIDAVSGFFSGIFGGGDNQNLQPVAQISLENKNLSESENETVQLTGQLDNQTTQTQTQTTNQTADQTKTQQQINSNQQIDSQDENLQPDQLNQNEPQSEEQQTNNQQLTDEQQTNNQQQIMQTAAAAQQCSFSTTQSPLRQGVVINEIAWMGATDDANNEWIELKNISSVDVNINNWQLIDKAEQIKINLASINGSTVIKSGQFVLLERTDDNSVPNTTADLIYTGALSNTDEGLRLFDGQCNLIDEALANPDWPAGNNSSASERKTMERDLNGFNWHTSTIINGTPKKENLTPIIYTGGGMQTTPQASPQESNGSTAAKILINEIQISPTSNRFIKLYNPSDLAINLTGYYIQRKTSTGTSYSSLITKTYFENKTIPARSFLLIYRNDVSTLTLTESNTIQIKNSDGEIIDKVGWGEATDCEGNCAIQPGENQSIKRKLQNNIFADTDNNLQDFEIQTGQANQAPGAFFVSQNVVLSEISAGTDNSANEEFIELYNPTDSTISLANYSLKRKKSQISTSTTNLVSSFPSTSTIAAKSFFLITHRDYLNFSTSTLPDLIYTNNSNPLSYTDDVVILYYSEDIVDEIAYEEIIKNQSIERKAFSESACLTAQNSGEFLGNSCANAVFDARLIPKPQNSLNLPEPRNAPTAPQNFSAIFSSSTMQIIFNWQPSQDFSGVTSIIKYKINDLAMSDITNIGTTSTEAKIFINEVGRDYEFSIQALDKDGLGSETANTLISTPSFISNLHFYTDPADSSKNLIEAYFNSYPFIPDLFGQNKWQNIIFYLNDSNDPLVVKYNQCSGGFSAENSLILPNSQTYCSTSGGAYSSALDFDLLEDDHFIIQLASSSQDITLTNNDFISTAFYATYSTQTMDGRIPNFQLVASDKTKYYFGEPPTHEPPQLNGSINLIFDSQNSRLNLDWPKATDPDTLDSLLIYELKYNDSDEWLALNNATGTSRLVSPSDNFSINLRAKDDSENYSEPALTTNWSYPATNFYINQTEANDWSRDFGQKDGTETSNVNLQSIMPQENFQFNKVVLKVRQTQANNSANLKLSVYTDNGSNWPDFANQLGYTMISDIFRPDENQNTTFNFTIPISLSAGGKYWLALEIENYNPNNYNAWHSNSWQNAISSDIYQFGEAGKAEKNRNGIYGGFSAIPNHDWYMKIGLQ